MTQWSPYSIRTGCPWLACQISESEMWLRKRANELLWLYGRKCTDTASAQYERAKTLWTFLDVFLECRPIVGRHQLLGVTRVFCRPKTPLSFQKWQRSIPSQELLPMGRFKLSLPPTVKLGPCSTTQSKLVGGSITILQLIWIPIVASIYVSCSLGDINWYD